MSTELQSFSAVSSRSPSTSSPNKEYGMTAEDKVSTVREVLEALGFGSDEPISGAECVARISSLYYELFVSENLPE